MAERSRKRDVLKSITVPVFVDSVKKERDFKMTRMNFLVIDYEEDHLEWNIDLEQMKVPYVMVGPYNIIHSSLSKTKKFDSTAVINNFFTLLKSRDFMIGSRYIWLPNSLLEEKIESGDCYRINLELLIEAYKFTTDKISKSKFLESCKGKKRQIRFEKDEGDAFRSLGKEKVELIRKKRKDLLDKSEKDFYKLYSRKKERPKEVR